MENTFPDQVNLTTGLPYKGKNQEVLQEVKQIKGYSQNGWMTFYQALKAGFRVKKGEKGTRICTVGEVKKPNGGTEKKFGGYYFVFNLEQTEKAE